MDGAGGGDHWVAMEGRFGAELEGGSWVGGSWVGGSWVGGDIGWNVLGSGNGGIPGILYTGAGDAVTVGPGVEFKKGSGA